MPKKKTKAETAQAEVEKTLKGLRKADRDKVVSSFAPEPETREVKVEEPNELIEELKVAYAAYRDGNEVWRTLEGILRRL